MKKWEYKLTRPHIEDISAAGRDGWELVQIVIYGGEGNYANHAIFKRPIINENDK